MSLQLFTNLLQSVGIVPNIILLTVVCRKALWKTLPVFALLIFYATVEDYTLTVASHFFSTAAYRMLYWGFAVVDYSLQLSLIWEIARVTLRPRAEWIAAARKHFLLYSSIGALLAGMLVVWVVPGVWNSNETIYDRVSLYSSLLTCVCMLTLYIVANLFGLPRKSHTRAIGQGLALWNIASIVGDVSRITGVAPFKVQILDFCRMITWDLVLIYWAKSLWSPERDKSKLDDQNLLLLEKSLRW